MEADWEVKTHEHRAIVQKVLWRISAAIRNRAVEHDYSKLEQPEAKIFARYTDKLRGTTYGSSEYKKYLAEMKPALDHHYAVSRHHPEHFEDGINEMTLLDVLEMLVDWKAATLRHADGDIWESLKIQQEKLGISDQLLRILGNTVPVIQSALEGD